MNNTERLSKFKETRPKEILRAAQRILAVKDRYIKVSEETGVPWDFIAVLHLRESNLDFKTHLHNGDPLTARTKRVPAGYPKKGSPPFTWEESAVDALKIKKYHLKKKWDLDSICEYAEVYNGLGYRNRKLPSPYLWAGSDQYTKGKYVSDGKFDANHVDQQLGVIPVLVRLRYLEEESPSKKEIVATSRKLTVLQRVRNALVGLTSAIMALDWMDMLGQAKQVATDNAGILIIGSAAVIWGVFKLIEQYSIQDYEAGRYIPSQEEDDN